LGSLKQWLFASLHESRSFHYSEGRVINRSTDLHPIYSFRYSTCRHFCQPYDVNKCVQGAITE